MAEHVIMHPSAASTSVDRGTASSSIKTPSLSETETNVALLTEDVGGNRSEVRVLTERVEALHQVSHDLEWRTVTSRHARENVATMLSSIADLGFAWRDIARLVGVSVPALQKWRKGEKASGDNRLKLAGILAACEIISSHYMVADIASWFEVPLSLTAPVTPIDLYANGNIDLVFEFASGHSDPEALLSQFDPEWREHFRSDFEVFDAGDGHRSIRAKG